ncbi:membrane protein [Mangrovimonas yunxiaonensis]|uniref:Membrane protein n=1 Tax=Mangrovimonas yunxiaonensis TaxID=1197477 RepID=A0A084TKJ1_9FLAO|nr:DUF6427 family protein [Mangrovimonas yunxiaonensis]KFB01227.1 membrane protein [Mangrovimonas yunxiaonensis]GGH37937.1 hypothetical protein GCM10011364_06310 [Mangrovimonas yunxiaonensis]
MISSFFSKAKPIHFLVVSLALLLAFVLAKVHLATMVLSPLSVLQQTGVFLVCLFSVFVFDFVTGKNNLTKKNSYRILFFTLFLIMIPQAFLRAEILMANLFILLAMRRIISMRSKKELKKKLFDAAFWISLATLLYFWACLFFILIFAALFVYRIADIKNWIIPFTSALCVTIIAVAFQLVVGENRMLFNWLDYGISFDFTNLNAKHIIISTTIILSYFVWSLFYYLKSLKAKAKSYKPAYVLVLIAVLIATIILVVSPEKTGAEFVFMFAPLAIIFTNYIETVSEKWFKEILIWILILTPFLSLIL